VPRREIGLRVEPAMATMDPTPLADHMEQRFSGGMIRRPETAVPTTVPFVDDPTVGRDLLARRADPGHVADLRCHFGTIIVSDYADGIQELSWASGVDGRHVPPTDLFAPRISTIETISGKLGNIARFQCGSIRLWNQDHASVPSC
jgi:hypothetical protein